MGGQRIRDERNKRRQTTGAGSTDSEPGGSAGSARRKIDSVYEFKLNKLRNAFFHDRPHTVLSIPRTII